MKVRARVLARDVHLCQPCRRSGRITPATEVDHVTSKAKGGTDDPDNLEAICRDCHQTKTAREAAEAQGRAAPRARLGFDRDGWPVWPG